MRKFAAPLVLLATIAKADLYEVTVTRIGQDLYQDLTTGIVIQTQFCYEYVYYDDAILKYEQYSYGNKIVFEDGEACDVKRILK
jgi:hypothetical protein